MSLQVHLVNGFVFLIFYIILRYNLPGKDLNGKSDPYVILKVGSSTAKSKVIKKTVKLVNVFFNPF